MTILPSAGSAAYYRETYDSQFRYIPVSYLDDKFYLEHFGDQYEEAMFVAGTMRRLGIDRVYMLGPRVGYFFADAGVSAVGDWVGPAGYYRLYRAIGAGEAADYLRDIDVAAVLVDPKRVIGGLDVPLERQLRENGFCDVPVPGEKLLLLVRSARACQTDVLRN